MEAAVRRLAGSAALTSIGLIISKAALGTLFVIVFTTATNKKKVFFV